MKRKSEAEAKQKKYEEEKAIEEAKTIEKEKIDALAKKKASIPAEPESGDPNSCEIAFRLPSGKRIMRRFYKSSKIEVSM